MPSGKNNCVIVSVAALVLGILNSADAKSVYAIINHTQDLIGAYKIQEDQIVHQLTHQAPTHGNRVVDIIADPSSNYLFVTYETPSGSDVVIELINAKTMTNEGSVLAPGAFNLAGLAVEESDNLVRVFTVDRGTNHLFVYHWDAEEKELTLVGDTYIELDYGGAMGVSLDNINHHLFVTNATNTVHYYDTDTWIHQGSVDVGRVAFDIEVDAERKYLYTGGYKTEYHTYLVKTWIGDPNSTEADPNELDIGKGVIGLGLDSDSGLVYATTYHNELRVYDCSTSPFTLTDSEDISAGAGVCVSDVSYKPPFINVYLEDGISESDDPNCVVPGDYITYKIHFETPDVLHNLWINDTLPLEVDFDSALPDNYVYDDAERTVSWYFEVWDPNYLPTPDPNFYITVQVNEGAEPLGEIVNFVEIESDNYYSRASETTPVCC